MHKKHVAPGNGQEITLFINITTIITIIIICALALYITYDQVFYLPTPSYFYSEENFLSKEKRYL